MLFAANAQLLAAAVAVGRYLGVEAALAAAAETDADLGLLHGVIDGGPLSLTARSEFRG